MTDAQKRYAMIEKELLAVVFGCERFHQYIYGKEILVESDHKSLENIPETITSSSTEIAENASQITEV